MMYWTVDGEKTQDHWLEAAVLYPPGTEPKKHMSVYVKWDGCMEITIHHVDDDDDRIHICDFPEFVKLMNELLHISNAHFTKSGKDHMDIWSPKRDIT